MVAKDPSAEAWLRLARSECRAGDLRVARGCLKTSFYLNEKLCLQALEDPDLEPLWRNIGKL
jgi:hypothetical protein